MSLNEKTNGLLKTVLILIILEVLYEIKISLISILINTVLILIILEVLYEPKRENEQYC